MIQESNKYGNIVVTGENWQFSTHRLLLQISFPVLNQVVFDSVILAETESEEFQAVFEIAIQG